MSIQHSLLVLTKSNRAGIQQDQTEVQDDALRVPGPVQAAEHPHPHPSGREDAQVGGDRALHRAHQSIIRRLTAEAPSSSPIRQLHSSMDELSHLLAQRASLDQMWEHLLEEGLSHLLALMSEQQAQQQEVNSIA